MAQSVERVLGKDEVTSSNLVISSKAVYNFCCIPLFFLHCGRRTDTSCVVLSFLVCYTSGKKKVRISKREGAFL